VADEEEVMPQEITASSPAPHERILAITLGFWQSRALAVAAELELAEALAEGPLHVDVLAMIGLRRRQWRSSAKYEKP
jgi:hypothetical protein